MAVDSRGPRNAPVFSANGASDDAADLTTLGQYAADVGTRRSGTSDERKNLDSAWMFDGLEFYETDTKSTYVVDGGAWVQAHFYSGTLPLPNRSGNYQVVDGAGFRIDDHLRTIEGQLTKVINGQQQPIGAGDRMFTMNEGHRPTYLRQFVCSGAGGAIIVVRLGIDGLLTVLAVPVGSSNYIRLEGISYYVD